MENLEITILSNVWISINGVEFFHNTAPDSKGIEVNQHVPAGNLNQAIKLSSEMIK